MTEHIYADENFAKNYVANGPAQFVPGYFTMHQMAAQLINEHVDDAAHILVLGAGGGLDLVSLGQYSPGWRFTGVDPSKAMLDEARNTIKAAGMTARANLVEEYIPDAPSGPFDAATCMLTLHFVGGDDAKLAVLKAIRARLVEKAPFVLVDLCLDKTEPDYDFRRRRYAEFAIRSGAHAADVDRTNDRLKNVLHTVSPERNESLIRAAGFKGLDLFYAGLSWRGWIASA
ncbi:MAG: class I SAM-dependent methyltransferase [Pseudomonadota bacterium]